MLNIWVADSEAAEYTGSTLLYHANPQIRSAAFSLVVHSSPSKQPLTQKTLTSLRLALPFCHSEVDPKFRQDNLALIKKLILRLTATLKTFRTTAAPIMVNEFLADRNRSTSSVATISDQERQEYGQHKAFLAWYLDFLTHELGPTSSYQRHVVSLKVLDFLFSNLSTLREPWTERNFYGRKRRNSQSMFDIDAELVTSLLDLVIDPFDDVRESAAAVLSNIMQTISKDVALPMHCQMSKEHPFFLVGPRSETRTMSLALDNPIWTETLCRIKAKMQSTGRADHADGFGRLYDLFHGPYGTPRERPTWYTEPQATLGESMSELEQAVSLARANLSLAVKTATLHGHLIAIRYCTQASPTTFSC